MFFKKTSCLMRPDEIPAVKQAARCLGELMRELWVRTVAGASGLDLVQYTWTFLKAKQCRSNFYHYQGFPAPLCVSVNQVLIHGIPNQKPFQPGDLVGVDVGLIWNNRYHTDAAFTKIIPSSQPNIAHQKLVNSCAAALQKGVNAAVCGQRTGVIGATIQAYLNQQGYFCPHGYTGHGIGPALHVAPIIPNHGPENQGPRLQAGMVICIEPMTMTKTAMVRVARDGWSVENIAQTPTAHFEAMVLITEQGPELLTPILSSL